MLSGKQRAFLRSLANREEAVVRIGKEGISEALLREIETVISARELIKIAVLETVGISPRDVCAAVCEALSAEPVQVIGSKVSIYRKGENPRIDIKTFKSIAPFPSSQAKKPLRTSAGGSSPRAGAYSRAYRDFGKPTHGTGHGAGRHQPDSERKRPGSETFGRAPSPQGGDRRLGEVRNSRPGERTGAPSRASGAPSRAFGASSRASGTPSRASGAPSRASGASSRASGAPSRTWGKAPRPGGKGPAKGGPGGKRYPG